MEVVRLDDATAFLAEAEPLLLADEARHNLILGIAGTIRDTPDLYPLRSLWLVRDAGEVVAAALRTPPYNLILARPRSTPALAALGEAVAEAEEIPGVVGTEPEIHEFAELWSQHSGVPGRVNMRQGVYALDQVELVPSVSGSARVATQHDRDLALRWWIAFGDEVLHEGGPGRERAEASVDHKLSDPNSGILLWEDGGEPVSLAGWGGQTPNGIRIGPVYTPPELRGHGYATAVTAELSERQLDGGRSFCFLYTDLANPTSNAIYERIGYRRIAEAAEVVFA
ncbi:MAG TPA: GNAT family N-acetyltransferase [Gaiellaceae bacterium]|nr:GNAT family N-acetyltransferase [Gaiellaceae bacterium]